MTEDDARRIYHLDSVPTDAKCPKCDRRFRFSEEVEANICAVCICTLIAYQEAMEKKFPSVLVDLKQEPCGKGSMSIIYAYGVPDGRSGEFMAFLLDELPEALVKRNVPYMPVMPFSESATKKYLPDVMESLRKELTKWGVI